MTTKTIIIITEGKNKTKRNKETKNRNTKKEKKKRRKKTLYTHEKIWKMF